MAHKNKSSWLNKQKRDPYVIQAKKSGYRSRASYKLLEINKANKLFRPGMSIVDLGAAPGGWSQVLANLLGHRSQIFAVDLLDMAPISGVQFIQGDFSTFDIQSKIKDLIANGAINWVISDMAPNLSGIMDVDQSKMMRLAQSASEFALQVLAKDGGFLIKLFQGEEVKPFVQDLSKHFKSVIIRKPDASRSESREIYVLAQGFRPINLGSVL